MLGRPRVIYCRSNANIREIGRVDAACQVPAFGLRGFVFVASLAASKVAVWTRLFLAIELVEHVVVVLAALLKVRAMMVRASQHLVYLHAVSAVDR